MEESDATNGGATSGFDLMEHDGDGSDCFYSTPTIEPEIVSAQSLAGVMVGRRMNGP